MRALCLIAAICTGPAALASDHPPIADVLNGATAIASPKTGYLVVTGPDGAFLCALNIDPNFFEARAFGRTQEEKPPAALCIPASEIENLGD